MRILSVSSSKSEAMREQCRPVNARENMVRTWLFVALSLFLSSGCMNAQNTRFPSWYTWHPRAENDAYERQDPFPDPYIGPDTDFAPPGYNRPRSEARRAAEQRMFQGLPVGPEYVRPGVPQGKSSDSRVVQ